MKEIVFFENLYAIIISNSFNKDGITFFTQDESSQQLAYMKHPKGKVIEPHFHNSIKRIIYDTQEVLYIKKGTLKVDFYDNNKNVLGSEFLNEGDLIMLIQGGHGFSVVEDLEMIEIKQGPYLGDNDKVRFNNN
jgi:mannose-6-phosphate isomerase-like protein (cupin superfamily)